MENPNAGSAQTILNFQKNFDDCHLQYMNQQGQAHMFNWMHAITP